MNGQRLTEQLQLAFTPAEEEISSTVAQVEHAKRDYHPGRGTRKSVCSHGRL
jgi:hypothetical protein